MSEKVEKMSFEDFWENIVGEVSRRHERINKELDDLIEWLLQTIKKRAVENE